MRPSIPALLALALLLPQGAESQDIELYYEMNGQRPPPEYYEQLARDPNSFRFDVEGLPRLERIRGRTFQEMNPGRGGAFLDSPALALGPRDSPIVGTFRIPVILGLFSDGPLVPPYSAVRIQQEYFDGPNSYFQTIPQLYSEMSGGLLNLEGTTYDWVQTGMTRADVTQGGSGTGSHPTLGVGGFIERVVQSLDAGGVNWAPYDRDGDGFVDIVAILHPTQGAECAGGGTNRIASHHWNLRSATGGRLNPGFQTSTPRPGGGFYYINDYIVQPVLACNATDINQIGVFSHEIGHAFGLPDLYGYGQNAHAGAGNWDLMGTGSWGCNGSDPARPCHMGAWSKAMLGWLSIEDVPAGFHGEIELEPIHTSHQALRIQARNGVQEYLLLENRQRIGSDVNLLEPGLLIWHIDQTVLAQNWTVNAVNANGSRLGVWLRQADGKDQLALGNGGNRGDRGDSYPGCIKANLQEYLDPTVPCGVNRAFHVGTVPAALTHLGTAFGANLTGIELTGSTPYSVSFHLDRRGLGVPFSELLAPFVGEPDTMSPGLRIFLDQAGNQTGGYDLGDFRAYLQQNPDAPLEAAGGQP